ncbi:hypothetical protein CC77DRAFT_1063291 [Alternaria alternata]|uniref:Rhodopsin domain-containing protein n=1 Tax=Alternaria alternata TaxID=5599 RepID=A0A177DFL9_ALTAL|nr:hypothetical protein CC77DRAFT_1063291 [Alternaria alternata]OAG18664.1 hypothetical protein CC77DRAFT_1063291 [Alternaria alternata]OWY42700.1 hypothetical protein AALT_g216 [Alternaria alternata]RYN90659.1 hypothetical protein AA0120_g5958 [Alternaria tenuissima]
MIIPIENYLQVWTLALSGASIAIAWIAVILRLVAKHIRRKFDYSDYCIVAALVSHTALCANCIYLAYYGAFGFDMYTIVARFGIDVLYILFKGVLVMTIVWNVTVCLSKLSVLLMYTSIIPNTSMLVMCRYIGATIILWIIVDLITALSICKPLAQAWKDPDKCTSQNPFYFSQGMLNLIIDMVIIVLPMPYIFRLRMPWSRKVVAIVMLGLGIGTIAITVYRQKLLWKLDFGDIPKTPNIIFAMILSELETAVMILVACIPLMRPLFWRNEGHSPPNGRHNANIYVEGGRLERGNKRRGARNLQLLYPPSWFDNKDDSKVAAQSSKVVRVADVASTSATETSQGSSCSKDSVIDKKRWEAPKTWHIST